MATTKAREKKSSHGTREARVQYIEELMRTFQFVRGKTNKELAKMWGTTESYCKQMSAEASKRIREAVMDPDTVNSMIGSALEQIVQKGMAEKKYRDVIEASKAWALISGAGAASRHEVTGKDGAPVCGPVIFIPPEDNGTDNNSGGVDG